MPWNSQQYYDHFLQNAPSFTIDGTEYWIVEGDLLMNEDRLFAYCLRRADIASGAKKDEGEGLIVNVTEQGQYVRWRKDMDITYFIKRSSFTGASAQQDYDLVKSNMLAAAVDWENICNVNFVHRAELDVAPGASTDDVVFVVNYVDHDEGDSVAAAFEPMIFDRTHGADHLLVLRPRYFALDPQHDYDKVGILRHELGHILGFRHEHYSSRAPDECEGEQSIPDDVQHGAATDYDPTSVMHYLCGGKGNKELTLSRLDMIAAQALYGIREDKVLYVPALL